MFALGLATVMAFAAPQGEQLRLVAPLEGFRPRPWHGRVLGIPFARNYELEGPWEGWEKVLAVDGSALIGALDALVGGERAGRPVLLYFGSAEDGSLLNLQGEAGDIERARALLRLAERAGRRPFEVDIWWCAVDEVPPRLRTRSADSEFVALSGLHVIEHARTRGRASDWIGLRRGRSTRIVPHQSGEAHLADGSFIHQPRSGEVFAGHAVMVRVEPVVGDDEAFVASVSFTAGEERVPIHAKPLGVPGGETFDAVTMASLRGRFHARGTSGERIVCWSLGDESAGPRVALCLRVRWLGTPATEDGNLLALPVRWLLDLGAEEFAHSSAEAWVEPWRTWNSWHEPQPERGTLARGTDEVRAMLENAVAFEPDARVAAVADVFIVRGSRAARERAHAVVADLFMRATATLGVEADVTGERGTALHRVAVPAIVGVPTWLRRGLSEHAIRYVSVEIGMGIYGPVCVIEPADDGLRLSALLAPALSGVSADVQLGATTTLVRAERELAGLVKGPIDQSSWGIAGSTFRAVIEPGMAIDLGDGPEVVTAGATERTRQSFTIR